MNAQIFKFSIYFFTVIAIALMLLFVVFLWQEATPFFRQNSFLNFIFSTDWDAGLTKNFGIFYILAATFYTAIIGCFISVFFSLGVAIFLSFYADKRLKNIAMWFINMLVGIPSIVYGFFAVVVIVGGFEKFLHFSTGECVLAASLILSLMVSPFFILNATYGFDVVREKYIKDSNALGVTTEFFILKILFIKARFALLVGFVLSFSRAVGETMAVMMVIGNAPIAPTLLSKAQTIASLIVLEMPMSEIDSVHYHALFAAALTLFCVVFCLNLLFYMLNRLYKRKFL